MFKRIFPILFILAVLLTACGAQGTPTMAPADVQNTAIAAAWTMVEATRLAIPTNTPLPPTEVPSPTSLPTFTPVPLEVLPTIPTLVPVSMPSATSASTDKCNGPLNMGEAGPTSPVRVENFSDGTITGGSLYLLEGTNKFGQCGYIAIPVVRQGATYTIEIPKGTWWAGVWITAKNGKAMGLVQTLSNFENNLGFEDLISLVVKNEFIAPK